MINIYEAPVATIPVSPEVPIEDICGINCNWGFGIGIIIVVAPVPGPT